MPETRLWERGRRVGDMIDRGLPHPSEFGAPQSYARGATREAETAAFWAELAQEELLALDEPDPTNRIDATELRGRLQGISWGVIQDYAKSVGLHPGTIQRIKNGKTRSVNRATCEALAPWLELEVPGGRVGNGDLDYWVSLATVDRPDLRNLPHDELPIEIQQEIVEMRRRARLRLERDSFSERITCDTVYTARSRARRAKIEIRTFPTIEAAAHQLSCSMERAAQLERDGFISIATKPRASRQPPCPKPGRAWADSVRSP